ncbi:MAG: CAP domain-containing protein [Planctomycetota bacterium]
MRSRVPVLCLIVLSVAASAHGNGDPYDYGDPTAAEQMVLERVNAVRADPDAFAAKFGYATGLYPARPPVVMSAALLTVARNHSRDMMENERFSHVSSDGKKANARVLEFFPALSPAHQEAGSASLGDGNTVENIGARTPATPADIEGSFETLMRSPLHRRNSLSQVRPDVDQAGIGIHIVTKHVTLQWAQDIIDLFPEPPEKTTTIATMTHTQEFARDDDFTPHVLGVVYEDRNANGLYDMGEGTSGVTIEVVGGPATTTASAGGFGMRLGTPGTYTLRASGGRLPEPVEESFDIADHNVKVDFVVDLPETFTLRKSKIKIDFARRVKAKPLNDSLSLKLAVDADLLPEDLSGVVATVAVAGVPFGEVPLVGNTKQGKFRTAKGVLPKVKLTVRRRTGQVTLTVKKADLMDAFGFVNETATGAKELDVLVTIGTAIGAPGSVTYTVTSKQDKKAKATATP